MGSMNVSSLQAIATTTQLGCWHARTGTLSANKRQRRQYLSASWNGDIPTTTAGTATGESDRLHDYLRSPFDILTFGPRVAAGALLSGQKAAENLQADVTRANTILQGPRPLAEKQKLLAQEFEARITEYLQKGAAVEAEMLTTASALLPEDIRTQLPAPLKDILLRGSVDKRVPPTPPTYSETQVFPAAAVAQNQTSAELVDLRRSVADLRRTIADLQGNADRSQEGVLKINVEDARTGLARRLQQLTPSTLALTDAPVAAATEEARILLREAQSMQL